MVLNKTLCCESLLFHDLGEMERGEDRYWGLPNKHLIRKSSESLIISCSLAQNPRKTVANSEGELATAIVRNDKE